MQLFLGVNLLDNKVYFIVNFKYLNYRLDNETENEEFP